jgi:2'-hydroxyisoflavone reductase
MNVLIIGGTRFQGRHLVAALLRGDHRVTVFHTGGHAIAPSGNLVDILGDRNDPAQLERIAGIDFDACIDTCAYLPGQVELLGRFLSCRAYFMLSSVYVYRDQPGLVTEEGTLVPADAGPASAVTQDNYGAMKVLCERMASACFTGRCAVLRPTMIIGPGDHTRRMAFWIRLAGRHRKSVLVDGLTSPMQFIDVRDLASFTVRIVEQGRTGTVNVAGEPVRFEEVINRLAAISGAGCNIARISAGRLVALGLAGLPYLEEIREATYSTALAKAWGLESRPLPDSLVDVYRDEEGQGFVVGRFTDLEANVLRLFA